MELPPWKEIEKFVRFLNFCFFTSSLVFRMVEAEEEYVEQLHLMISCFLRPLKMAASSQKPPCTHDDVNSIFLNSETVMFLHQIFLKGLTARMECWPTLVLGRRPERIIVASRNVLTHLYVQLFPPWIFSPKRHRRFVRHVAADAVHLSGICSEPSL